MSTFNVLVAEHDLTKDDGQERFTVCSKLEHPKYDWYSSDHDFSILTLCNHIKFKKEASPVCLPSLSIDVPGGVLSTVSGWGTLYSGGRQPDQLMEVDVTTMSNAECNKAYGDGEITKNMICAKGSGKDSCQGDSGGKIIAVYMSTIFKTIICRAVNIKEWWRLLHSDRHCVLGLWVC